MQQRDITTAENISDYGLHHLEYNCRVDHSILEETIQELSLCTSPFMPSQLIYFLDVLYYQLIDHSTDQEITMLKQAFPDYIEHREQHSKAIELLTSTNHQQLCDNANNALELTNALQEWSATHQQQERQYAIFQESLRFAR